MSADDLGTGYSGATESMLADSVAPPDVGGATVSRSRAEVVVPTTPWARVKHRITLPDPLTVKTIAGLDPGPFGQLVRDHLLPSATSGPEHDAWSKLWALLRRDDDLADRTFDVLEQMLDVTNEAIAAGSLDEQASARARKFVLALQRAWSRIEITRDEPLAWAGRDAAAFNGAAKRVLDQLVTAIAEHRRSTIAATAPADRDRRLWDVLQSVRLEPEPRVAADLKHAADKNARP